MHVHCMNEAFPIVTIVSLLEWKLVPERTLHVHMVPLLFCHYLLLLFQNSPFRIIFLNMYPAKAVEVVCQVYSSLCHSFPFSILLHSHSIIHSSLLSNVKGWRGREGEKRRVRERRTREKASILIIFIPRYRLKV